MVLSLRARLWRGLLRRSLKDRKMSIRQIRDRADRGARRMRGLSRGAEVEPVDIGGRRAAWIRPPLAQAGPLAGKILLHFHGGGYVSGSIDAHLLMCIPMARDLGIDLLLPEYRLAPESPFPAALEDALAAHRWLLAQGYAAKDIFFSGDSAGGGLALAAAFELRDRGEALPAAIVCISPWADLTNSGSSHVENARAEVLLSTQTLAEWALCYAGPEKLREPLVSPVFGVFGGLPPLLIQVGSEDILLSDSLLLAQKARAAGVPVKLSVWKGLWHVWHVFGNLLPESKLAFAEMAAFLAGPAKGK
jgi:acetyl esterase/lipase